MEQHTGHLYHTDYQYSVQSDLINNLPLTHCVVIMDFSENYTLQSQDEIESAHWAQTQITLHPIFIVHHAPNSTVDQQVLLKESLIIISDHLVHNAASVYVFTEQLMTHIRNNPGPCDVEVLHRWTDNCAVQYKCVEAFHYIPKLEQNNNIKLVYHFTEAGHGKGPSDGLGAITKKSLDQIILAGKVLNTAYEAYLALTQRRHSTAVPGKMESNQRTGLKTVHQ